MVPAASVGPNILVERFHADEECEALYEAAARATSRELYDSGVAAECSTQWAEIVEATGLVDSATIASEADRRRQHSSA